MEGNTHGFWRELAAGFPIKDGAYGALPGQNAMWINQRHTDQLPPASPQVVQTRKHSVEVRNAEPGTPYKFPLILGLAGVTAASVLEGLGGHSSHRGQASCCLPSEHPHETGAWQRQGGFSAFMCSSQLGRRHLTTVVSSLLSRLKVSQECLQVLAPSSRGTASVAFFFLISNSNA